MDKLKHDSEKIVAICIIVMAVLGLVIAVSKQLGL